MAHYEDADHDLELVDVDAPCGYRLTESGRALLVVEAFDEKFWPAPELDTDLGLGYLEFAPGRRES